jgi:hypothetical protein
MKVRLGFLGVVGCRCTQDAWVYHGPHGKVFHGGIDAAPSWDNAGVSREQQGRRHRRIETPQLEIKYSAVD